MTALERVSGETMRFMRGKYSLDEVSNGKDELKFRGGGKTVLTVYIREDRFDFLVIFGKAEREKFEARRDEFPIEIREIYDGSKTYHDGKWMLFPVKDLDMLEAVKELVLIKKKPNRKPFPKNQAVYSDCGHRCDLCVHYMGGTVGEEFRVELRERLKRVYEPENSGESAFWGDDMKLCDGCANGGIDGGFSLCEQKKCAADKFAGKCVCCGDYPCDKAPAGLRGKIEAKNMLADDVTWAILPYVDGQYGN